MTTKFSEVYDLFLGQMDDFELIQIDALELESVLLKYLINATSNLQESMEDINNIDVANKDFGFNMGFVQKSIFAKAMKLEWLREKKYSAELMRKSYGDRDFTAVQGYNYLKELNNVELDLEKQIRLALIEYSYREEFMDWTTS